MWGPYGHDHAIVLGALADGYDYKKVPVWAPQVIQDEDF